MVCKRSLMFPPPTLSSNALSKHRKAGQLSPPKNNPVRRRSWNGLGTVSERSRNGLGTVSERSRNGLGTVPLAPRQGFARFELCGRRSTFARSSIDFVAGAAFRGFRKMLRPLSASWGSAVRELGFRTVRKPPRLRRLCGGRAHWHGRAKVSQGLNCVAGAALSQGQVQILWQAQHRFGGRRSIFARSTFAAGARKSQLLSTKVVRKVNFRSWGLKIATFKYESSAQSPLLENRDF